MNLVDKIDLQRLPKHIAVIMDGNGRWAKRHGEERFYGHTNGVESVRKTINAANDIGIKFLTIYSFSTENWNRPKDEVEGLMSLFVTSIANEIDELHEKKVRVLSIGDMQGLPKDAQIELQKAIDKTSKNTGLSLVIALNYSARWEITNAMKCACRDAKLGKLDPEQIDAEVVSSYMATANIPDPELLIRTSGEFRISNFLLWQIAYAELYFTDVLWPDFRENELYNAIIDFQGRERRFGKTTEQLTK